MKKLHIKHKNLILLGCILIFALALRVFFFTGVISSDSLFYSEFANNIAKNEPFISNHLSLRLGIVYPVSWLYSILGVNEFSSNIIPLIFSLASIILIYKFGKLFFSEKTGLFAALLLSIFPLDVVFGTTLMGDIPSAFFVALSVYWFLRSERASKKSSAGLLCFFSGLSLGAAYLIREMSVLIGLFYIVYALYNKKMRLRYFLVALGFVLILSIELLYFLKAAGNPFYRYSVVSSNWANIILEAPLYSRGEFPFLLLHYPKILATSNFLGLFYPLIFLAIFYCIIYRRKETYSMLFWFVSLLLYISFGSTSITRYVLFPPDPRLLSIITFPGILLLSYFLAQKEDLIKKVLMPGILFLIIGTSMGFLYISDYRHSLDGEKAVYNYLKTLPAKQVYTDKSTANVFNYLAGYEDNGKIKAFNRYEFLTPEKNCALDLSQTKDSYVVINKAVINYGSLTKTGIKYPSQIFNIPKNWDLKKEFKLKNNDIGVYYAS